MSACARARICILCFHVQVCVRVCLPVHFPSPDPHLLRPPCLSLISRGPASCSHQGTDGLCWVPPDPTLLPLPSAPAASASLVSLVPLCPFLLCPSSSVCSLKSSLACLSAPQRGPSTGTQRNRHPSPPPVASQFQCPPQPGPPHLPGPRFSPQLSSPALPQTSYRSPCHLAAQVHFPQQNLSVVSSLPDHQPWVDPCSGGVPLRPPGRISSSACSDLQCLTLDSFFPKTGILSLGQLSGPVLSRHAPAFEADVSLL